MATISLKDRTDFLVRAVKHAKSTVGKGTETFAPTGDVLRTSSGLTIVPLRQEHAGIPIADAVRSVRFGASGTFDRITGSTVTVPAGALVVPKFTAAAAVHAAFLDLLTRDAIAPQLALSSAYPEVVAAVPHPSQATVLRKPPFEEPIMASLVIEIDGTRARLLWEVRLGLPEAGGAYLARVAASGRGKRPRVHSVERTSAHAVEGHVFEYDPDSPRTLQPFPQPRSFHPGPGSGPQEPEWVEGAETSGNNANVRDSVGQSVQAVSMGGDLLFQAANGDSIEQCLINAFYVCNLMHDFFYFLGFDEQAGNFQRVNEAGVGGSNDALNVTVRNQMISGFAYFENRADGTSAKLELGRFTNNRHTALDTDVVIHEFVHGVTSRVIGGKNMHSPLPHQQSAALGEGFSDYYALSILNYYRRRAGLTEEWVYGRWVTDRARGMRTASYDNYPNTYGFLRKPRMKTHKAGEVWCAALLDLNRVLAAHTPGGPNTNAGDEIGWQLVFDSLSLLHPSDNGPTFLHARDAVYDAFHALVAEGAIPADPAVEAAVRKVFRDRGMGADASSPNAKFRSAREGFQ